MQDAGVRLREEGRDALCRHDRIPDSIADDHHVRNKKEETLMPLFTPDKTFAYDVAKEGEDIILRIGMEGYPGIPSLEDDGKVMARTVDILREAGNVTRIVYTQRRDYEYPLEQAQMLVEIAKLQSQFVQQKLISYAGLQDPQPGIRDQLLLDKLALQFCYLHQHLGLLQGIFVVSALGIDYPGDIPCLAEDVHGAGHHLPVILERGDARIALHADAEDDILSLLRHVIGECFVWGE